MVTDHKHTHQTWLLQTCAAGWVQASSQGLLESELLIGACWCLHASAPHLTHCITQSTAHTARVAAQASNRVMIT